MNVEDWWNDNDKRRLKQSQDCLSLRHCAHTKSETHWCEIRCTVLYECCVVVYDAV